MNISILGQGFKAEIANSVGNKLIEFFSNKNFHTFTGFSAFVSQAGVNGLSKHILLAKKHFTNINIISGIDQKGTSKEALEALLNLKINVFVFYQPSFTIFHPKIYLFEGEGKSELIIGSSNLTSQGLFTNIETSLLVSIDNSIEKDRKIVEQLKKYFKGIFDFTDPNLKKLSTNIITDLVNAKIVPTETERKAVQDKVEKTERKETENIISKIFPKRVIAKIPKDFKGIPRQKVKTKNKEEVRVCDEPSKLLWESGKLTERDLNIPKNPKTNPTGSMYFKKGLLKGIDQRHYFRDTIFKSLNWRHDTGVKTAHIERAKALFKIIINGKDYGNFELLLSHNTLTNTRSYQQKNSMTSLSWGEVKKIIAKDELIGKNARLFKNNKKREFFLVID
jgi:HKD family nuclease